MRNSYQRFRRFAALLVGVVFLVSGLLKLIDPVGTQLIFQEYFKFFHLRFLWPAAKVLGVLLGLLESLLGIALFTGVLRKQAARCTYILLSFFTLVTLVLWIFNPPMDCGCFGQALHLTHAQSFWKNVVLLALSVFAFTPFHDFIVDFTEFDWGAELMASLDDEVAADNHYQAAYIYEKDGQEGVFVLDSLPDSSWNFVRVDTVFRVTTAVQDKYPVLSFRDAEGEYRDRMAAEGRVVVISVYDPADVSWDGVRRQYAQVAAAGGTPLVVVSAYPGDASLPQDLPLFYADYKTLITLNRSNGGGTYFCEGELVNKWDVWHVPENLAADFAADPVDLSTRYIVKRRLRTQGFCVYLAALLLLT